MGQNKKIWFSDEVVDFIKSHNALCRANKKYNTLSIYWDNCKYLETDNPNVFEVIFEDDLIKEVIERKSKDE